MKKRKLPKLRQQNERNASTISQRSSVVKKIKKRSESNEIPRLVEIRSSISKNSLTLFTLRGGHMAPPGKDCPGPKNWTGPEARAFGTFIII